MEPFNPHNLLPDLSALTEPVVFLNSNGNGDNFLGIGVKDELIVEPEDQFVIESLDSFLEGNEDWIFGYFSYDLKNSFESLSKQSPLVMPTPLLHLVKMSSVLRWNREETFVFGERTLEFWKKYFTKNPEPLDLPAIKLQPRIQATKYIKSVDSLLDHIRYGNIYEVNYCQEFGVSVELENSYTRYLQLNTLTEAPFSAYARLGDLEVMCASPERFLKRNGDVLISQPIKGTIRRSADALLDGQLRSALQLSEKDRSENVMIVDLVRNDLSRIAEKGSVKVDELFGVYSFKTVHHLISTISAKVRGDIRFSDILRATFPMGSMTGAPKISAMNLIDSHEASSRGLYSGSLGYIAPNGDFDFNVVIRSLIYNRRSKYLSCSAGGAITALSDPQKEYEESLLKAEAIQQSLALN